ncbi:hypothetical protein [Nocardioides zeae]|uniref:hypothetical protein n=1 Tax=Nocardioides zeae TaxID=1457234 RepID=UPI0028589692|nr:hypothetical protein [Nocardioides zeae]MDR6172912.1 DNA-binding MarR family transcriptional regulator [Nocardioides zeae]
MERRPHPDDRRATLAAITDEGRALVDRATADLLAADFALGSLGSAEQRGLSDLLAPVRRDAGDF